MTSIGGAIRHSYMQADQLAVGGAVAVGDAVDAVDAGGELLLAVVS
jgi:hypothetical protein